MNGRQRRVLQVLAVVLVVMILFPPVRTGYSYFTDESYAFIFALPFRSSVNVGLLLVQWLFAGAVGGIAFVLSKGDRPTPDPASAPAQPCAICHVSRTTRLVLFRSNVSYLFGRRERQLCEYLCLPCMSRNFLRYEAVTLVGTWWGLIGLAVGPGYLISNIAEYAKGAAGIAFRRRA